MKRRPMSASDLTTRMSNMGECENKMNLFTLISIISNNVFVSTFSSSTVNRVSTKLQKPCGVLLFIYWRAAISNAWRRKFLSDA